MQDKFRTYRRPNGMFYAEEYQTRHRESLQTKDEAKARRLIAAKNQAAQPGTPAAFPAAAWGRCIRGFILANA